MHERFAESALAHIQHHSSHTHSGADVFVRRVGNFNFNHGRPFESRR
jgi:hypothetical protein